MGTLSQPVAVVTEITLRTPFVGMYLRHLEEYVERYNLISVRAQEPEFGRGVVLRLNCGLRLATHLASRIIQKAEAAFSEAEKAKLAQEEEYVARIARDDAQAGI